MCYKRLRKHSALLGSTVRLAYGKTVDESCFAGGGAIRTA